MNEKSLVISRLEDIYNRWQELLASLNQEQIATALQPSPWTTKDVIAHLWFWQEASVARAEAVLQGNDPHYPTWWELFGPDPNEDVDRTNAWNYERCREKPWQQVYVDWSTQFSKYLKLIAQIPDEDLLTVGRFKWMGGYSLSASVMGSYDHHQEHLEMLTAWLNEHGKSP
ncbi:MAG: hypothetical protein C3F13_06430 [Anaerolineales bacterium]|nr:DinB family protein [Anaerolineae bacterium]PWB54649.1 MAG: hypothetical protein C3F13_06430 [Anaerolineales bacterium]